MQQLCSCQHFPRLVPAYLRRAAPPGPAAGSAPVTAHGQCKKWPLAHNWGCPWCWDSLPSLTHRQHGCGEVAAAEAPSRRQLTRSVLTFPFLCFRCSDPWPSCSRESNCPTYTQLTHILRQCNWKRETENWACVVEMARLENAVSPSKNSLATATFRLCKSDKFGWIFFFSGKAEDTSEKRSHRCQKAVVLQLWK